MKKALALILALMMAIAVAPAFADSLVLTPGTPAECTFESFKSWYDVLTGTSNFTYTWDETPVNEDGYEVYTAHENDGLMELKVYLADGKISHMIGTASGTFAMTDTDSAQKFGSSFGAVLAGGTMGLLISEDGYEALGEKAATFESELMPLADLLTNGFTDITQLSNGLAADVILAGYPAGLDLTGSILGTNITINMRVLITSKDGQLTVTK